ncbi:MAG: right-handed parallel beta-helix repeat-containing protein [Leptospiraceae bacterium]|nr:right-handed parallel beta-helix repeat-containing protein [Leptospiraceae bacterium]
MKSKILKHPFSIFRNLILIIFILNLNCILVKSILDSQKNKSNFSFTSLLLSFFHLNSNSFLRAENWSNPSSWNSGSVPTEGENVIIPSGKYIILDVNPPKLGAMQIDGILEFAKQDISLTAKNIMIHGTFQIGSETEKFTHKATITLNDTDTSSNIMDMGTRGIVVMGEGKLELHGESPAITKTQIANSIQPGNTNLTLKESVDWQPNDEIILGTTDYYHIGNGNALSQKVKILTITANNINFDTPSTYQRWGVLQYATTTGMSLNADNLISPPSPNTSTQTTPRILDERAHVGHLTRNILIQAEDDEVWQNQGFGVHIMIMGKATAHVDGVEIKRAGQRGRLRRYPFHWHMLSYGGTETYEDASGQYFKNSSIHNSKNRGLVIHGTNGILAENNVIFDVEGHGIFLENAVERRNTIDGNLVLFVRNSPQPLKIHESGERGSSCFWLSNPDNIIRNNIAADCANNGFWLAFPTRPFGESANVLDSDGALLNPARLRFGTFDNNTANSNRFEGIMVDNPEIDESGNISPHQYQSTTNGRNPTWPLTTLRRFTLSRYKVWKNGSNGIWDRAVWPDNYEVVAADNCGRFFAGSGSDGIIERSLVVGTSLNHLMNGIDRLAQADFAAGHTSSTPVAFATYHSAFDIKNNIVVNFLAVANTRSGAFSTDDYYIRPVEKGTIRNSGNLLVNSHAGVKLNPPFNHFTLASALHDPFGFWGPAGNYYVYDNTFLTHGKAVTLVNPGTAVSGGVSVSGPFYGFEGFVLHGVGDTPPQNQPYFDLMALFVIRWNSDRSSQLAT